MLCLLWVNPHHPRQFIGHFVHIPTPHNEPLTGLQDDCLDVITPRVLRGALPFVRYVHTGAIRVAGICVGHPVATAVRIVYV